MSPPVHSAKPIWAISGYLSLSQGNESRLTSQRPQYLHQVFWVPRGALAASFDGSLVCDLTNQIESEVADDGHIFSAVAGAQA